MIITKVKSFKLSFLTLHYQYLNKIFMLMFSIIKVNSYKIAAQE